jgi:DNA-binding transcriptional MerR regulator
MLIISIWGNTMSVEMLENTFFTIGQISKILRITRKALKHWEKLKLINPSFVDPDNNYRYYNEKDILTVNIIKKMKYHGFTLHEIKSIIQSNKLENMIDIYEDKMFSLENELLDVSKKRSRVKKRLDILMQAKVLDTLKSGEDLNDFKFKKLNDWQVVYVESFVPPTIRNMLLLCDKLISRIEERELDVVEPFFSIYHDDISAGSSNPVKVSLNARIRRKQPGYEINLPVRLLPGGAFLSVYHKGNLEKSSNLFKSVNKFLLETNQSIAGPLRRMYLFGIEYAKTTENLITELLIPVKKTSSLQ